MHLTDPDLLRDLRLREPLEEPQVHDLLLARRQDRRAARRPRPGPRPRRAPRRARRCAPTASRRCRRRAARCRARRGGRGCSPPCSRAPLPRPRRHGRRSPSAWVAGRAPGSGTPMVRSSSRWSSCTRRGTRTAHPLSRKCRFNSPWMVGVANDENCSPRSGSKRSTALTNPTSATWRRSSSGSPRFVKRRARNSARRMWSWTSSLRIVRSRVRRYSANRASIAAVSRGLGAARALRR